METEIKWRPVKGEMVFSTPLAVRGFHPLTRLESVVDHQDLHYKTKSGRLFREVSLLSDLDTSLAINCELELRQATSDLIEAFGQYQITQKKREWLSLLEWERIVAGLPDEDVVRIHAILFPPDELQPPLKEEITCMGWYYANGERPAWWPEGTRYLVLLLDDRIMAVDKNLQMTRVESRLADIAVQHNLIELTYEQDINRELP